ncbi:hypothetical protein GCM10028895_32780 [Pontibacter rugosus]
MLPSLIVAQTNTIRLKGNIKDAATHAPVPYASIGLQGKDIGTVSNSNGAFELSVAATNASDTLVVSMMGYEQQRYTLQHLAQKLEADPTVLLEPAQHLLQEVKVTGQKLETNSLGNKATPSGVGMTPFKFSNLGNEIGLLCKVKGKITYLEAFNIDIFLNDYDTLFFRMNIYTLENGLPKENILHEPVYLQFTGSKGKASIDLVPYDIVVDEDFVVSLEYVKKLHKTNLVRKEQSGLYFGAKKLFGGTMFTRYASQGKWMVSNDGLFAPKMEVVVKQ